jgi:hypothetical protein
MADPPYQWQLFPTAEYSAFSASSAQDDRLAFSLLMCLSGQHRFTGAFRLCIFGGGELSVTLPIEDILYPTPPEFSHLSLLIAVSPRDITLQPNSMASAWVDIVDMLREKSALIVNGDEEAEEHTQLVEHLLNPASKKANLGASLRWMVAARADSLLILELQMLPVPARMLNKQNLRQDNAVCVLLKHFRIRSNMFGGEDVSGPMPLLFVPDRSAAEAALRANPVDLLEDIKTLNERILLVEHLSLPEAVAYMQSRHRAAKGFPVFPAVVPAAAAAKRPRTQARDDTSTGTALHFLV